MSNLQTHREAASRFRAMAMANSAKVLRSNDIAQALNATLVSMSSEGTELEIAYDAPKSMATNFGGLHGGVVATLLDEACSFTVFTQVGIHCFLGTAELNVSYHRRTPPGPLTCKARLKAQSARTMSAEADVYAGGLLTASARSLMLVDFSRPLREAWVEKASTSE